MAISDFRDFLYPVWYKDSTGKKISVKRTNETYEIINNKVLLKEIPDEYYKVIIPNYYEIKSGKAPAENEFSVDYYSGEITFNSSQNAKTITVSTYFARGLIYIFASRVISDFDPENNNINDTLKSVVDNFTHRGEYSNIVQYYPRNIVFYAGGSYMAIKKCKNIPPSNKSYWQQLTSPGLDLVFRGEFDVALSYDAKDAVSYGGSIYYCLTSSTGHLPTETAYWSIFMPKSIASILKNTVTFSTSTSNVAIGISGFNYQNDELMVFVNSTYVEKDKDYKINIDGLSIDKIEGTWSEDGSTTTINFLIIKNVLTNINFNDGSLLQDASVPKTKLTLDVQNKLNEIGNLSNLNTSVKTDLVSGINSHLADTVNYVYVNTTGNTTHSTVLNAKQAQATSEGKFLFIQSGDYTLDATVTFTDNIVFDKNVTFTINADVDGLTVNFAGKPIDFNGLKIFADVTNYSKVAFRINGSVYNSESDMNAKWLTNTFVGNLTILNKKTVTPYTNVTGTGAQIRVGINQIFMFTHFKLLVNGFQNGLECLTDSEGSTRAFVSSCLIEYSSWSNTNALVFTYNSNNPWSDLHVRLINETAPNMTKVIKLINNIGDGLIYSPKNSYFDLTLWDIDGIVPEANIPTLIDATSTNKYYNHLDIGVDHPITKYCNYIEGDSYNSLRTELNFTKSNIYNTNPYDYMYLFGSDILSTDTFTQATDKLINKINSLKFPSVPVILEYTFTPSAYDSVFRNKLLPLIPTVPHDIYQQGKIKITFPRHTNTTKQIFVEFTSATDNSIATVAFQAYRYYDKSTNNDSKWTILGNLYCTTAERNALSAEIRRPRGFMVFDTTLTKPVFAYAGVWVDATGATV